MKEIHVPRPGEWGSTGATSERLSGHYYLPAGDYADRDRREVLAKLVFVMYGCVGSAQSMPSSADETTHAVHQMVISNGALAVGEADALLTLIAIGMDGPAAIHLRGLSELVMRVALCCDRPELALKLYKSWGASYEAFLKRNVPGVVVDGPELDKADREMRKLEVSAEFRTAREELVTRVTLSTPTEREFWSKRSHGDIMALAHVSMNLRHRGDDVRGPILHDQPFEAAANVYLTRAIGLLLYACKCFIETFGVVEAVTEINPLVPRHQAMIEQDEKLAAFAWRQLQQRAETAPPEK